MYQLIQKNRPIRTYSASRALYNDLLGHGREEQEDKKQQGEYRMFWAVFCIFAADGAAAAAAPFSKLTGKKL